MNVFFYKLTIEYKGTRYFGWQIQPHVPTIQGELNKALAQISQTTNVKTLGSGRTDAGVHALGQVVKVEIPLLIDKEALKRALNALLPQDIRVIIVENTNHDFMPTLHAKSKEYQYLFTVGKATTAFENELLGNFSYDDFDLEKMKRACDLLKGEHDFTNYFCVGTEVSSYIRKIFDCEVYLNHKSHLMLPSYYTFRIVGNGFLKQMVRLLVGALWNVARGKCSIDEFKNSLTAEKRPKLGPVSPANGLYLVRVNY